MLKTKRERRKMFKKMFKECTMETEAETAGKVMAELEKCIMTIATFC